MHRRNERISDVGAGHALVQRERRLDLANTDATSSARMSAVFAAKTAFPAESTKPFGSAPCASSSWTSGRLPARAAACRAAPRGESSASGHVGSAPRSINKRAIASWPN